MHACMSVCLHTALCPTSEPEMSDPQTFLPTLESEMRDPTMLFPTLKCEMIDTATLLECEMSDPTTLCCTSDCEMRGPTTHFHTSEGEISNTTALLHTSERGHNKPNHRSGTRSPAQGPPIPRPAQGPPLPPGRHNVHPSLAQGRHKGLDSPIRHNKENANHHRRPNRVAGRVDRL